MPVISVCIRRLLCISTFACGSETKVRFAVLFLLYRHIFSVSLVRETGNTATACLSGASFRNLESNVCPQASLRTQRNNFRYLRKII